MSEKMKGAALRLKKLAESQPCPATKALAGIDVDDVRRIAIEVEVFADGDLFDAATIDAAKRICVALGIDTGCIQPESVLVALDVAPPQATAGVAYSEPPVYGQCPRCRQAIPCCVCCAGTLTDEQRKAIDAALTEPAAVERRCEDCGAVEQPGQKGNECPHAHDPHGSCDGRLVAQPAPVREVTLPARNELARLMFDAAYAWDSAVNRESRWANADVDWLRAADAVLELVRRGR